MGLGAFVDRFACSCCCELFDSVTEFEMATSLLASCLDACGDVLFSRLLTAFIKLCAQALSKSFGS